MSRNTSARDIPVGVPLRPCDVADFKMHTIPVEVIGAFNCLIARYFSRGQSSFLQNEVIALLEERGHTLKEIYDKRYLDVEEIYEAAGWKVVYDKPGYNESGEGKFTFIAPPKESGVPR